jgi:methyltransferase
MFAALMAFLLIQRVLELVLAERNRRWAREQGGRESGQWHYPLIVAVHVAFYISLALEYRYLSSGWNPLWPVWLAILVLAQALRVWAIVSLGRYWNTRIIVIPGRKPVIKGPYRLIRHPNYLVVATEIFVIPVLCGAYFTAAAFSAINAVVLYLRIREEERALAGLGGLDLSRFPRFIPRVVSGRENSVSRRKTHDLPLRREDGTT